MFRALSLVLLAAPATAQVVVEGAALSAGVAVEAGVSVERAGGTTAVAGPSALVRVRLAPRIEARLGLPDPVLVRVDGVQSRGVADPALGLKADLGEFAGWAIAGIAEVSVPLGDAAFSGPASPVGVLLAERAAGPLTVLAQAEAVWDRAERRVEVGGAAVVGAAVSGAVAVFAEAAAATSPDGPGVLAVLSVVAAVAPTVEVDLHVGAGLAGPAPATVAGVGVSVRL